MDADAPAPIARWLRATRERQSMPGGQPWTQDYFLARLAEDEGWDLARSNYSKYETGAQTPKPETLERFVRFWARRGEGGPDFTPPVDPMIAAMDRQTEAIAAQAVAFTRLADAIEQMSDRVTRRVEDSAVAFEDVVAALRKRQPRDGAATSPATGRTP